MHSSVFSNNALEYLLDIKISAVICKRQLQKEHYLLHRPYKQQSRKQQQQNALQQQQQKGIIPLLLSIRQQQKPQKQRRRRLQPWQTQFLLLQKKATPTIKLKISTTATTIHKFLHFHNITK